MSKKFDKTLCFWYNNITMKSEKAFTKLIRVQENVTMTDGSRKVFNFLKENAGLKVTGHDIADALDVKINVVTGSVNGLVKKGYAVRTEEQITDAEGKAATVKYISLTDAGLAFDPDAEQAE